MLWYVPHIYTHFQCKASLCRHNCCIGWEIDVDEDTAQKYATVPGSFGKRLSDNMIRQDGITSFCLTEGERCPFLNGENLCDIHLTLGEDHLCQICSDHPRFRNYFSSFGEIGLGMSCEEAARLVLSEQAPMTMIPLYDDGEETPANSWWESQLIDVRCKLMSLAQNRECVLEERETQICTTLGVVLPAYTWAEWADELLSLERMDPMWDILLQNCKTVVDLPKCENQIPYEQFLVYLLFRHIADATDVLDLKTRVAFCVICSRFLRVIAFANPQVELTESARLFSAEIEYSPDNTDALLALLENVQEKV